MKQLDGDDKLRNEQLLNVFAAVSSGVKVRSSKISVLRAVQRAQQTQGRMSPDLPDGGKPITFLNSLIASFKFLYVAM